MIINENLYTGNNKMEIKRENIGSHGYSNFNIFFNNIDNLINGENYTVSFEIIQDENGCGKINAGPILKTGAIGDSTEYVIVDNKVHFTFTYDKDNQGRIGIYTDLYMLRNFVGAVIKNIKIEKGDQMTPYLPHKSKVKPSNQAIFLSGGGISRGLSNLVNSLSNLLIGRRLQYEN